MRSITKHIAVPAGLLLCSAAAACASTLVSFQVDLTAQAATFNPTNSDRVQLRGSLSELGSWGVGPWLTNNAAGSSPYLFTTTLSFAEANATQVQYKYVIIPYGDTNLADWSHGEGNIPGSGNRLFQLAGGAQNLPLDYFSNQSTLTPPGAPVTFQIDMTAQVNAGNFKWTTGDSVEVRGASGGLGSWGSNVALTNDATASNPNLFSGTFILSEVSGYTEFYKFVMVTTSTTWEGLSGLDVEPGGNRFFSLDYSGVTLAPVYFNDIAPAPLEDVDVTFSVDMSAQILQGGFDPSQDTAGLAGSFQGWNSTGNPLTNNPYASNTNIYSTVIHFHDFSTALESYKFVYYGGTHSGTVWESPTSTGGGNRSFNLGTNATLALPVVFFNDVDVVDLLKADTWVTFSVNMTNAVGTDSTAFDPATSTVWLNGVFGTWWSWSSNPAQWQMTNNPAGSEVYSLDVLFPAGSSLVVTYKYGLNGSDNEAAQNKNHIRYIRSVGHYAMPLDTFGAQTVESSFGNLTATLSPDGKVLVSWLGRPGVRLQTQSYLGSVDWFEHAETDGLSSTNWTASGKDLYFRLVKH